MGGVVQMWMDDSNFAEILANIAGLEYIRGAYGRYLGSAETEESAKKIAEELSKVLEEIEQDLDVVLTVDVVGKDIYGLIDEGELIRHGYLDETSANKKAERMWDYYAEAVENEGYVPDERRFYEEYMDEISDVMYDNIYLNPDVETALDILEEKTTELLKSKGISNRR